MFRAYLEALMRQQPKFGRASAVYAFTTENLAGHFPALGLADRGVLTVSGSGDHALSAVLFGAAAVTAFDVNPTALLWSDLKVAAVRALAFEEFQRFFLRQSLSGDGPNPEALSYDMFAKIKAALSSDTAKFFEALYAAFDYAGPALRQSAFFNPRSDLNARQLARNPFLASCRDYELLRSKLASACIRYRECSVLDVAAKERGQTYDVIILSNLCDYAVNMFAPDLDPYRSYIQGLCRDMLELLAPDGVICAAYLYVHEQDESSAHSALDVPAKRRQILEESGFDFREVAFPGANPGTEDAVVLLTRRQYDR
jgi:hypothetical protein